MMKRKCASSFFVCLVVMSAVVLPVSVTVSVASDKATEPMLWVTRVERKSDGNDRMATVVLGGTIAIHEIEILEWGIKFPYYQARTGVEIPQVEIDTTIDAGRDLMSRISEAIRTGKPDSRDSKLHIKYRIGEVRLTRGNSGRKANVKVTLNGVLVITVGVMDGISERTGSPYKFISWPSRNSGGDWIEQVAITNMQLKSAIDKALIREYDAARTEMKQEEQKILFEEDK